MVEVKDDVEILQLENKGLRFQNEVQQQKLRDAARELHYLRRFKNLIDRAGAILDKLTVDNPVV